MALELFEHCTFTGPAFPEPFIRFELEKELSRLKLLPKTTGEEGRELQESWEVYRRQLRELVSRGGPLRVRHLVLDPLVSRLGFQRLEDAPEVETREGREAGGWLLTAANGTHLRVWATALEEDLDAPARRGRAFRFSHLRIAQRVLLAAGERLGLLTNGLELRLLISDPARLDSQIEIALDPHWKRSRTVPDSFRLLLAMASPEGIEKIPDLLEKARLQQTRVTRELRHQARQAVERFVQEVLDQPANRERLDAVPDKDRLARDLWREGLILVYRLLFIFKLEASDDPARVFSFASSALWRRSYSPTQALAPFARLVLEEGRETGRFLEDGLRALFFMFNEGLTCTELNVKPLGGALFGGQATPWLTSLAWGERAVAHLLDLLLWTPKRRGAAGRERVHYGSLEIEDLGRVYEALLELEPGITTGTMCRLRRAKLEVVVPAPQGEKYKPAAAQAANTCAEEEQEEPPEEEPEPEEEEAEGRSKKTKVEWIEEIPPQRFYLRVGLGRKATGTYYTPHSFVRFLVKETLGPQVEQVSPPDDPRPDKILKLKVLDPAMGSGHFLIEACRFLGEKLYEACRWLDEAALAAERVTENTKKADEREQAQGRAQELRSRLAALGSAGEELARYLPSHAPEGEESGYSLARAQALCRRLVAVHCLYGVDKNPLAVELAKLALWLETHAEGLPLTFLDHRLVVGDSLTGPFFEHLLKYPGSQQPMDDLFTQGLQVKFRTNLAQALRQVRDLEATVGASLAEIEAKQAALARLEEALTPFKLVAAAWAGGVMLGPQECDDEAYARLVQAVAEGEEVPPGLLTEPGLAAMLARGLGVEEAGGGMMDWRDLLASGKAIPALSYELAFPEVFYPHGDLTRRQGFHAVLGNPPWDAIQFKSMEFFASFDFEILNASQKERAKIEKNLLKDLKIATQFKVANEYFEGKKRSNDVFFQYQKVWVDGDFAGRYLDEFRVFMERNTQLLNRPGRIGVVVPSAFHANEGATGIRRLYLNDMALHCCYSFENRRKLFEIHSSFKFALVVASRLGPTPEFRCAFYLHQDEWLFGDHADRELLYNLDFVRKTGGQYLSFPEIRFKEDYEICNKAYSPGESMKVFLSRSNIQLTGELNMTLDRHRFESLRSEIDFDPRSPETHRQLIESGRLILVEGKTFWQFDDRWGSPPRFVVPLANLMDKKHFLNAARFYRFGFRSISSATNERTVIFSLFPPGVVFGHSVLGPERVPFKRANYIALYTVALANSFCFDYLARMNAGSNVSLFIIEGMPMPRVPSISIPILSHLSLRLTCNHKGYQPLWNDQLENIWREQKPQLTWPVLPGEDERWGVRAAIDAVVAQAYGLNREQYAHVLSTFSHASYPKAPELCLARFDELETIGLEAFTRKYDPYWDIPLNENLPEPVIDLPLPEEPEGERPAARRQNNLFSGRAEFNQETYELLKLLLEEKETITSADAQDLTNLSAAALRPYFQKLAADGLATSEGRGRGARYRYTGAP
ncbi:MAG: N-6 DNA methylase [Thermodesulfobacteriota bacterium]